MASDRHRLSTDYDVYSLLFSGDPALSVLDSVLFHELLHVVRIDYPTDDGIADFLTIDPHKLDILPDYIYSSENGTNPIPVSICNVTSIVERNNGLTVSDY